MASVVLLRHGESEWNRCDKYAGWIDVDLTQRGIDQAKEAGSRMSVQGMDFDICYTSVLKRATHTAWHCLDSMDRTWIPITRSRRLNERHYGALHGLSRAESVATYGEEQVRLWRRGFADRPPRQIGSDQFKSDPRYIDVQVPDAESLQDTVFRVAPLLESLTPALQAGARILVVAHGNSLRAILKVLCNLSDIEISGMEMPNP
jgi:2,3-bisphosphoglycerate-dependent phosphoglycerate mutase